jgi:hypothetical protein
MAHTFYVIIFVIISSLSIFPTQENLTLSVTTGLVKVTWYLDCVNQYVVEYVEKIRMSRRRWGIHYVIECQDSRNEYYRKFRSIKNLWKRHTWQIILGASQRDMEFIRVGQELLHIPAFLTFFGFTLL